ncbi:hypothetical protein [Ammoniphilus sp. 3BR4]
MLNGSEKICIKPDEQPALQLEQWNRLTKTRKLQVTILATELSSSVIK